MQGAGGTLLRPWTVIRGREIEGERELVVNETAVRALQLSPGALVTVRADCGAEDQALPPVAFRVAGIATFPFDDGVDATAATDLSSLAEACGEESADAANIILVTSTGDAGAAAEDIATIVPHLRAMTNEEVLGRLQATGFTYFRQISAVLTTVTVSFALLLITVLLTVSVNQRLGEVAALRALGFSRRRVVADVLCESALIVGIGGALSLPLGIALAGQLDSILKRMPGVPVALHFFVFEPGALAVHAAILGATAILAALYPMYLVSRLPIASTLRSEVTS
jgi:putative ABC transport system permease protein